MEQGAKGKEQEKQGEKPNEKTIQWLALSTMLRALSGRTAGGESSPNRAPHVRAFTATAPLIDALRQGFGGLGAGHFTHFDFVAELLAFTGAHSTRSEVMFFESQRTVYPEVSIEHCIT
jgi:hypothetical protein